MTCHEQTKVDDNSMTTDETDTWQFLKPRIESFRIDVFDSPGTQSVEVPGKHLAIGSHAIQSTAARYLHIEAIVTSAALIPKEGPALINHGQGILLVHRLDASLKIQYRYKPMVLNSSRTRCC